MAYVGSSNRCRAATSIIRFLTKRHFIVFGPECGITKDWKNLCVLTTYDSFTDSQTVQETALGTVVPADCRIPVPGNKTAGSVIRAKYNLYSDDAWISGSRKQCYEKMQHPHLRKFEDEKDHLRYVSY